MKNIILVLALSLVSIQAQAAGDPASLKVKVFGVYASTSPLCTNPVAVFLNTTGEYVDLLKGPTLGGGDLPDGTYECVIIKMADVLKHTPLVTDTSCVAGTEYTGEVCKTTDTSQLIDGTAQTCKTYSASDATTEDTVFMFMTTNANASAGSEAFVKPTDTTGTKGIKLGAPLVISSTTRAKFVVDATGKVVAGGGECGINAPKFSFVKL